MSETLNPSEAVYGFAGWLTCRNEKVVFSSGDDAAVVADLVQQFCDANKLPKVSEHWPQHLIHPQGEVAAPGVGHNREDNENRIRLLQYKSLRDNFQKMVNDILGDDYYNMGMDVYECDRLCCEDITHKAKESEGWFSRLKKWAKRDGSFWY